MFATPSILKPKAVVFEALICPCETVRLFCIVADEPVPDTEKEP